MGMKLEQGLAQIAGIGLPFQGAGRVGGVGPRALPSAKVGAALWANNQAAVRLEER